MAGKRLERKSLNPTKLGGRGDEPERARDAGGRDHREALPSGGLIQLIRVA